MPVTTSPVLIADARLDAQRRQGVAHLERGPDRPQRVVLVHLGHAEDGHHGVADELLDRAAMCLDDGLHALEVAREQRAERLGICGLAQRRRAVTSQKRTVTVLRCSRAAGAGASGDAQLPQNF